MTPPGYYVLRAVLPQLPISRSTLYRRYLGTPEQREALGLMYDHRGRALVDAARWDALSRELGEGGATLYASSYRSANLHRAKAATGPRHRTG
jgi:hypothetical protein